MKTHEIPKNILVGVDTGGTFTDFVLVDGERVVTYKLPSTPDDPSRAVLEGLRHLAGDRARLVFHGSTVATNALLEGKGDAVALVVTAGFRDLLAIGRQNRPKLYALQPRRNPPLVPRERTFEIEERILADGSIEIQLEDSEIERVVSRVEASGCRSVALCLLHSYANPVHELKLSAALEAGGLQVSASCHILSEYREFERASTTVVNAAVSPVMARYIGRLQRELGWGHLKIMQSNGGSLAAENAGREAVRTILSGPAGGMVGAFATAKNAGFSRVITFDMGGTSTDVSLCDGTIPFTTETVIADWPVKVPMIDIHTVGAGGGSIARIDPGGALRVGPQSAGADPGPVCYGKGVSVTVTDANLYLGRLLPERFLGGRMPLDLDRCRRAIDALASDIGLEPGKLAEGIIEVAEATMAGALRVVSIERGHDPRDFSLLPFGGAGGLHACALAEKLAIPRVLIPSHPGLLSAVGMVLSDAIRDYSCSLLLPAGAKLEAFEEALAPMRQQALEEMAAEGMEGVKLRLEPSLDIRYRGQSFEVNVPLTGDYLADFHASHEKFFGYRDELRPAEVVTLRLRAIGTGPRPDIARSGCVTGAAHPAGTVPLTVEGKAIDCPLYERDQLPCGGSFAGPALVVEETATHLVRPEWIAHVDMRGNLVLTLGSGGES